MPWTLKSMHQYLLIISSRNPRQITTEPSLLWPSIAFFKINGGTQVSFKLLTQQQEPNLGFLSAYRLWHRKNWILTIKTLSHKNKRFPFKKKRSGQFFLGTFPIAENNMRWPTSVQPTILASVPPRSFLETIIQATTFGGCPLIYFCTFKTALQRNKLLHQRMTCFKNWNHKKKVHHKTWSFYRFNDFGGCLPLFNKNGSHTNFRQCPLIKKNLWWKIVERVPHFNYGKYQLFFLLFLFLGHLCPS